MNFIQKYIKYLKDNPKNYWFKRRLYGWGWVPAKWQGWVVIIIFIIFLLKSGSDMESNPEPTDSELQTFFIKIILSVVVVILICYKTGEKPRWQWGLPKDSE